MKRILIFPDTAIGTWPTLSDFSSRGDGGAAGKSANSYGGKGGAGGDAGSITISYVSRTCWMD